jgi:DNA polymerase-1
MEAIKQILRKQGTLFDADGDLDEDRHVHPPSVGREILRELAAQLSDEPPRCPVAESRVLLLDGRALLDAAYHAAALADSRGPSTMPNGAIAGYANGLMQLFLRVRPTHALAAFDHPDGIHERCRKLPSYKENRADKPLDHLAQIDVAMRLSRLLGIRVVYSPAGEADDVIATALRRCPEESDVTIYSRDKDLLQLLARPRTGMLWRLRGEWQYGSGDEAALSRLGVRCAQVGDFLALCGDSSDNIPGCPGIGEKTAARLLQRHNSLSGIQIALGRLDVPHADRVERLLREGWKQILLARSLVNLRTDLSDPQLPCNAAAMRWHPMNIDEEGTAFLAREVGLSWIVADAIGLRKALHRV